MRIVLPVLFVVSCCLGCKAPDRHAEKLELPTLDQILYPEEPIVLPSDRHQDYLQHFFLPWHLSKDSLGTQLAGTPGKGIDFPAAYQSDPEYYGENKQQHTDQARERLVRNADFEGFPTLFARAITVRHTDVRKLPTDRPGFDRYSKAGEGYPFDYFQETGLWAFTPLLVLQISKDLQWYYALTPFYKGWVPAAAVAFVDGEFIDQWQKGPFCYPVKDYMPVRSNAAPEIGFTARIGMVLPVVQTNNQQLEIAFAVTDASRKAVRQTAAINRSDCAFEGYVMNKDHLQSLLAELLGQAYGWGGYLQNRDCSSTLRDLFTPFGIWLPRDSRDQAVCGKITHELPKDPGEKLAYIAEKGVPFLSILYKPGHAMLYVGNDRSGTPLIFHTIWGLKTSYAEAQLTDYLNRYPIEGLHRDQEGKIWGRYLIGQTILSPVTLGEGLPDVDKSILEELSSMTIFNTH